MLRNAAAAGVCGVLHCFTGSVALAQAMAELQARSIDAALQGWPRVDLDPAEWRKGRDLQLEKAVEVALAELKAKPLPTYKKPAYPNYNNGNGPSPVAAGKSAKPSPASKTAKPGAQR